MIVSFWILKNPEGFLSEKSEGGLACVERSVTGFNIHHAKLIIITGDGLKMLF